MAFVSSAPVLGVRSAKRAICRVRMNTEDENRPMPKVSNEGATRKKLVRNVSDTKFADASAGDMVGAPQVGEGMGPRRGVKEKKVTKAAAIQKSKGFADAWAEQNQGRLDVWFFIGLTFLLTPLLVIVWGVWSGAIPIGGLFE